MYPVRLGCADEHAVGYVPGYPSHRLCPRGTAVRPSGVRRKCLGSIEKRLTP